MTMTTKEVKEYLNRAKKLEKMIANKTAEVEQWKSVATGVTAQLGNERVQSSGSQQKMADAVGRYIDIENEIKKEINALYAARKNIISMIEKLNAEEYDILHKHYIQYMEFGEIADVLDRSYSLITTIHGKALRNLIAILEKEGDVI